MRASPGRARRRPGEPAGRREYTRRIDQDHLRLALQRDPQHPRTGGLRLGTGDGDLLPDELVDQCGLARVGRADHRNDAAMGCSIIHYLSPTPPPQGGGRVRSEEHTSELQSLMRISYAVFCLKKKKKKKKYQDRTIELIKQY